MEVSKKPYARSGRVSKIIIRLKGRLGRRQKKNKTKQNKTKKTNQKKNDSNEKKHKKSVIRVSSEFLLNIFISGL